MKWLIANKLEPGARLYWSDSRGSWGSAKRASRYARQYPEKEMPLCFRGAVWIKESDL